VIGQRADGPLRGTSRAAVMIAAISLGDST
jgi:hypothetical protein